jgi:hypothetical protein
MITGSASLSRGSALAIVATFGRDSNAATRTASRAPGDRRLTRSSASFGTPRGGGNGAPAVPAARLRTISSAKNGLPPDNSAIRASTGLATDVCSRALIT